MISVENLTFGYDEHPVLKGISFTEQEPVITGLWGRNGAGKTTLMKLMAGHMKPGGGSIRINGHEPYNNPEAQKHLCYMMEDHIFSSIWTVRDALRFYKYFNPNWNQGMADQLIETFKLPMSKNSSKLSTGMKTALQLVIGLASQADITILDEPTNGLDAGMRKKFYELLLDSYDEYPRLILVSTHHIEEIQPLLESLVVVHEGKLMMNESMEQVRERGFWLSGERAQVDQLTEGQRILDEDAIGTSKKVMIDASLSDAWRKRAQAAGVSLEKAQLQDYLLQMTDKVKEASL
ncbi:ATP-binding cassette domain-containing protein [Paenibacillus daejeonensis]|uniref:ABC transporter ATP-binding protein n=1 Tax=Paenibacillus daejeonensis TaxID=135193 RepID=UPI000374467D|nr:ABC transporter ATP-binding protein [Paenibacillus daejeonensis]